MGKKITQYPNNVSTNPDTASLLDLSEKTGTTTYESRKWTLSAMMTWLNANGAGGKSAYEIAVDNGFVGTESDWLLSLEGTDGTDGITPVLALSYNASGFTLSTGNKNIYIPSSTYVGWSTGSRVRMYHNATNYMEGIVTSSMSYPTPAGSYITINIDYVVGSGTYSVWNVFLSGDSAKVSGTTNYVPKFTSANILGDSQIFDNGTNVGVGIGSPTEKLHVNGNVTADNYYINNVPYAILPYRYRKNVSGISNAGYTTICNVNSIALSSGVRISIMGTTAGTVITVVADILVNYLQDIYIESKSGMYSVVTLKVISDDAENFTIQATTNSAGVLTAEIEVYPLNSESVVFAPSTIYSGSTHIHECVAGFAVSATGGTSLQNGNVTTLGNVGVGLNEPNYKLDVYSMNTGADHKGVKIYAESGTNTTGLSVESLISTAGEGIGAEIISTQNTVGVTTYGVKAYGKGAGGLDLARSLVSYGLWADCNGGIQNIGLYARSYGTSGTNYSCQLIDGTENVDKILKSVTSDGKANWANFPCEVQLACSDETTALTTGVKTTIRIPNNMRVTEVRASLTTAQTSGSIFTVDLLEGGVSSIFGTKLTVDNGETTSKTALTPPTFSASPPTSYYLADDTELKVSITQIGDGTAKGLKILIKGYRVSW